MCFTCLSLHISVNPVIIVSFYAHVLPDLFTLLELLLQCLDTWYPLINCSYCCHCSNSSLQPPAEPWQHLGFPSFLWRSDKCWKLGAVPETGWLFNMPADNHCLGSCTQSAWVSGVQCRVCSEGKSSSYVSNLETFDDWASDPWNNGKEVPRLDLTSSTTPGQQIHRFEHTLTANPCDWLPCRRTMLPLIGCPNSLFW